MQTGGETRSLTHEEYMRLAIALAKDASADMEPPVGCVIIDAAGNVAGRGRNARERTKDVSAHAEIEAMREAARYTGDWRLDGCTLYVTLEPCPMCAAAIAASRIRRVYFGARDDSSGTFKPFMELPGQSVAVTGGVLADECAALLSAFFKKLRS